MVGVLDGLSLSWKAEEFIWWAEGELDEFWSRARLTQLFQDTNYLLDLSCLTL